MTGARHRAKKSRPIRSTQYYFWYITGIFSIVCTIAIVLWYLFRSF